MVDRIDKTKILVVDDDPDILLALMIILESRGYQVVSASNGLEALEKVDADKPDLMILDLLMPKMDGFEVYRRISGSYRPQHRNMPILILTSVREEASRRRYELETGRGLGGDDYLEKPFMPDVLLKRVEKLIRKNETPAPETQ